MKSSKYNKSISTPQELRRIIERLSPSSSVANQFTAAWRRQAQGQKERKGVWDRNLKENWLNWLAGWDGPGYYGRKDWDRSARYVYNHIANPRMLLYLAEAAGIGVAEIEVAARAALKNSSTMTSMSAAVRRVFPWETVEQALLGR